jgi:hypothetical protein
MLRCWMSIIKKSYEGLGSVTFHGIAVGGMELARGIEPPTCGLQNRCSAD